MISSYSVQGTCTEVSVGHRLRHLDENGLGEYNIYDYKIKSRYFCRLSYELYRINSIDLLLKIESGMITRN